MSQSKILIDTNVYLRLAKTIRPLLYTPFGVDQYCLYILPELNQELENRKLKNKFPWVEEVEFTENRKYFPKLSKKQHKSIQQTFEYVWDYVQTELPGPSKVDALYIAYSLEMNVPVITDDQDMTQLAHEFGASVMPTLKLLKIMFDCGHTDMKNINALCDYWRYISDLPANFKTDFQLFFGKK